MLSDSARVRARRRWVGPRVDEEEEDRTGREREGDAPYPPSPTELPHHRFTGDSPAVRKKGKIQ